MVDDPDDLVHIPRREMAATLALLRAMAATLDSEGCPVNFAGSLDLEDDPLAALPEVGGRGERRRPAAVRPST